MLSRLYRRLPSGFFKHQKFNFMNQLLNVLKRKSAPLLGTFIFLLLTIVACNETDKKTSTETETSGATPTDSSPTTASAASAINVESFPVLCITKQKIETLFANQGGQPPFKLVFTFNMDGSMTLNPSLTAFRARSNDEFIDATGTTLIRNPRTYSITGAYHFGNLELTRIKYEHHIKALPGYPSADRLLFYPFYESTLGSINYRLAWGVGNCTDPAPAISFPAQPFTDQDLNPCPPNQPGQ